jgi:TPR repeat protein
VTRGLEAVKNRQKTLLSVNLEADAEKLFRDALDAYRRGNFAEAVKGFRKAADQGHAVAQFNLGVMYNKGHGVEKNEHETVAWFRKAAEQGYAPAQCNLGVSYEVGRGVEKNEREAVAWFRKAATRSWSDVSGRSWR